MITRNDIIDALTKSSAYDNQHTPTPTRILIDAWCEHFQRFAPGVDREMLLDAVTEYHRVSRDRILQPADLSAIARAFCIDDFDRSPLDSPRRLAFEARCDAKTETDPQTRTDALVEHRDRLARVVAGFDPGDSAGAAALSRLDQLTDSPLRVGCEWCGASPGEPCVIPKTNVALRRRRAHPARTKPGHVTHPRNAV